MRAVFALVICIPLTGCYVKMHGNQSTSGGTTTTTTSSQVGGSARFAGGRASFSSGQPVSPNAPGGHLKLSGGAAAVLVVGVVIADLVNYVRGEPQPRPLPADARVMDTCSCFGYQPPVTGGEIRDTGREMRDIADPIFP